MLLILKEFIRKIRYGGGKFRCIICKNSVRKFFPFSSELQAEAKKHGFEYEFQNMETLNVEQCNCPFCMSIDRERFFFIFLQQYMEREKRHYHILDFAPSEKFSERLKAVQGVRYASADFYRDDVDLRLDICNMSDIADESYDIVICSHILEHVEDPDRAIGEIRRILKTGGIAILMVPLFEGVSITKENLHTHSEAERYRLFGQGDHVRLFSKADFLDRIRRQNLFVTQITPKDLDERLVMENAIAQNSVLYVNLKPV